MTFNNNFIIFKCIVYIWNLLNEGIFSSIPYNTYIIEDISINIDIITINKNYFVELYEILSM